MELGGNTSRSWGWTSFAQVMLVIKITIGNLPMQNPEHQEELFEK